MKQVLFVTLKLLSVSEVFFLDTLSGLFVILEILEIQLLVYVILSWKLSASWWSLIVISQNLELISENHIFLLARNDSQWCLDIEVMNIRF